MHPESTSSSTNPYAPPTAPDSNVTSAELLRHQGAFFAVSIFKLVIMSVCTLGLYHLFWFFKNWKLVKARERAVISPFWRTFFSYFFCYGLFSRVRDYQHAAVAPNPLEAGLLTTAWIVLSLTWRLPDPYGLMSLLAFLPLIPVQARVNRINAAVAERHDPNSHFTGWNLVAVVVGSLLLTLSLIGTFLLEDGGVPAE